MIDSTGHDDNDLTERLLDDAMTAIADAGFAPTIEELRAYANAATVSVLRTLADAIAAAEEDDVVWPDADDLRILAGEIEEGARGV